MTQKEYVLAAYETAKDYLLFSKECLEKGEYFNALNYLVNAQKALAGSSVHLCIASVEKDKAL